MSENEESLMESDKCSFDSGIASEKLIDFNENLLKFNEILQKLQAEKKFRDELRKRLSQLTDRRAKKKKTEVCNVCFAQLDPEDIKNCTPCCICEKYICRGNSCSFWLPKLAKWECQLCNVSQNSSKCRTSEWINKQVKNENEFYHPIRARSELNIPAIDERLSMGGSLKNIPGSSPAPSTYGGLNLDKERVRNHVEEVLADMLGGSLDSITVGPISKDKNYHKLFHKYHSNLSEKLFKLENSVQQRFHNSHQHHFYHHNHNRHNYYNHPDHSKENFHFERGCHFCKDLPLWENNGTSTLDNNPTNISHIKLKRLIEKIIEETLRIPQLTDLSGVPPPSSCTNLMQYGGYDIHNRHKYKNQNRRYSDTNCTPIDEYGCNEVDRYNPEYFDPKRYQELLATAVLNKIVDSCAASEKKPADYIRANVDHNQNKVAITTELCDGSSSSSSHDPRSESSLTDPVQDISLGDISSRLYADTLNENLDRESVLNDSRVSPKNFVDVLSSDNESVDDFASVTSGGDSTWEENWLFKKRKLLNHPTAPIGMLVPAPKEDVKTMIGDRSADEISDSSENELDDDVNGNISDLDPGNARIQNKIEIGGQNAVGIFDELMEHTSLISRSSSSPGGPNLVETKNDYVDFEHGLNVRESPTLDLNCGGIMPIKTEAVNSAVSLDLNRNRKTIDDFDKQRTAEIDIPTAKDNETEMLNNQNDGSSANETANRSARRPSTIEFLASIALGPVLTICTPDINEDLLKTITKKADVSSILTGADDDEISPQIEEEQYYDIENHHPDIPCSPSVEATESGITTPIQFQMHSGYVTPDSGTITPILRHSGTSTPTKQVRFHESPVIINTSSNKSAAYDDEELSKSLIANVFVDHILKTIEDKKLIQTVTNEDSKTKSLGVDGRQENVEEPNDVLLPAEVLSYISSILHDIDIGPIKNELTKCVSPIPFDANLDLYICPPPPTIEPEMISAIKSAMSEVRKQCHCCEPKETQTQEEIGSKVITEQEISTVLSDDTLNIKTKENKDCEAPQQPANSSISEEAESIPKKLVEAHARPNKVRNFDCTKVIVPVETIVESSGNEFGTTETSASTTPIIKIEVEKSNENENTKIISESPVKQESAPEPAVSSQENRNTDLVAELNKVDTIISSENNADKTLPNKANNAEAEDESTEAINEIVIVLSTISDTESDMEQSIAIGIEAEANVADASATIHSSSVKKISEDAIEQASGIQENIGSTKGDQTYKAEEISTESVKTEPEITKYHKTEDVGVPIDSVETQPQAVKTDQIEIKTSTKETEEIPNDIVKNKSEVVLSESAITLNQPEYDETDKSPEIATNIKTEAVDMIAKQTVEVEDSKKPVAEDSVKTQSKVIEESTVLVIDGAVPAQTVLEEGDIKEIRCDKETASKIDQPIQDISLNTSSVSVETAQTELKKEHDVTITCSAAETNSIESEGVSTILNDSFLAAADENGKSAVLVIKDSSLIIESKTISEPASTNAAEPKSEQGDNISIETPETKETPESSGTIIESIPQTNEVIVENSNEEPALIELQTDPANIEKIAATEDSNTEEKDVKLSQVECDVKTTEVSGESIIEAQNTENLFEMEESNAADSSLKPIEGVEAKPNEPSTVESTFKETEPNKKSVLDVTPSVLTEVVASVPTEVVASMPTEDSNTEEKEGKSAASEDSYTEEKHVKLSQVECDVKTTQVLEEIITETQNTEKPISSESSNKIEPIDSEENNATENFPKQIETVEAKPNEPSTVDSSSQEVEPNKKRVLDFTPSLPTEMVAECIPQKTAQISNTKPEQKKLQQSTNETTNEPKPIEEPSVSLVEPLKKSEPDISTAADTIPQKIEIATSVGNAESILPENFTPNVQTATTKVIVIDVTSLKSDVALEKVEESVNLTTTEALSFTTKVDTMPDTDCVEVKIEDKKEIVITKKPIEKQEVELDPPVVTIQANRPEITEVQVSVELKCDVDECSKGEELAVAAEKIHEPGKIEIIAEQATFQVDAEDKESKDAFGTDIKEIDETPTIVLPQAPLPASEKSNISSQIEQVKEKQVTAEDTVTPAKEQNTEETEQTVTEPVDCESLDNDTNQSSSAETKVDQKQDIKASALEEISPVVQPEAENKESNAIQCELDMSKIVTDKTAEVAKDTEEAVVDKNSSAEEKLEAEVPAQPTKQTDLATSTEQSEAKPESPNEHFVACIETSTADLSCLKEEKVELTNKTVETEIPTITENMNEENEFMASIKTESDKQETSEEDVKALDKDDEQSAEKDSPQLEPASKIPDSESPSPSQKDEESEAILKTADESLQLQTTDIPEVTPNEKSKEESPKVVVTQEIQEDVFILPPPTEFQSVFSDESPTTCAETIPPTSAVESQTEIKIETSNDTLKSDKVEARTSPLAEQKNITKSIEEVKPGENSISEATIEKSEPKNSPYDVEEGTIPEADALLNSAVSVPFEELKTCEVSNSVRETFSPEPESSAIEKQNPVTDVDAPIKILEKENDENIENATDLLVEKTISNSTIIESDVVTENITDAHTSIAKETVEETSVATALDADILKPSELSSLEVKIEEQIEETEIIKADAPVEEIVDNVVPTEPTKSLTTENLKKNIESDTNTMTQTITTAPVIEKQQANISDATSKPSTQISDDKTKCTALPATSMEPDESVKLAQPETIIPPTESKSEDQTQEQTEESNTKTLSDENVSKPLTSENKTTEPETSNNITLSGFAGTEELPKQSEELTQKKEPESNNLPAEPCKSNVEALDRSVTSVEVVISKAAEIAEVVNLDSKDETNADENIPEQTQLVEEKSTESSPAVVSEEALPQTESKSEVVESKDEKTMEEGPRLTVVAEELILEAAVTDLSCEIKEEIPILPQTESKSEVVESKDEKTMEEGPRLTVVAEELILEAAVTDLSCEIKEEIAIEESSTGIVNGEEKIKPDTPITEIATDKIVPSVTHLDIKQNASLANDNPVNPVDTSEILKPIEEKNDDSIILPDCEETITTSIEEPSVESLIEPEANLCKSEAQNPTTSGSEEKICEVQGDLSTTPIKKESVELREECPPAQSNVDATITPTKEAAESKTEEDGEESNVEAAVIHTEKIEESKVPENSANEALLIDSVRTEPIDTEPSLHSEAGVIPCLTLEINKVETKTTDNSGAIHVVEKESDITEPCVALEEPEAKSSTVSSATEDSSAPATSVVQNAIPDLPKSQTEVASELSCPESVSATVDSKDCTQLVKMNETEFDAKDSSNFLVVTEPIKILSSCVPDSFPDKEAEIEKKLCDLPENTESASMQFTSTEEGKQTTKLCIQESDHVIEVSSTTAIPESEMQSKVIDNAIESHKIELEIQTEIDTTPVEVMLPVEASLNPIRAPSIVDAESSDRQCEEIENMDPKKKTPASPEVVEECNLNEPRSDFTVEYSSMQIKSSIDASIDSNNENAPPDSAPAISPEEQPNKTLNASEPETPKENNQLAEPENPTITKALIIKSIEPTIEAIPLETKEPLEVSQQIPIDDKAQDTTEKPIESVTAGTEIEVKTDISEIHAEGEYTNTAIPIAPDLELKIEQDDGKEVTGLEDQMNQMELSTSQDGLIAVPSKIEETETTNEVCESSEKFQETQHSPIENTVTETESETKLNIDPSDEQTQIESCVEIDDLIIPPPFDFASSSPADQNEDSSGISKASHDSSQTELISSFIDNSSTILDMEMVIENKQSPSQSSIIDSLSNNAQISSEPSIPDQEHQNDPSIAITDSNLETSKIVLEIKTSEAENLTDTNANTCMSPATIIECISSPICEDSLPTLESTSVEDLSRNETSTKICQLETLLSAAEEKNNKQEKTDSSSNNPSTQPILTHEIKIKPTNSIENTTERLQETIKPSSKESISLSIDKMKPELKENNSEQEELQNGSSSETPLEQRNDLKSSSDFVQYTETETFLNDQNVEPPPEPETALKNQQLLAQATETKSENKSNETISLEDNAYPSTDSTSTAENNLESIPSLCETELNPDESRECLIESASLETDKKIETDLVPNRSLLIERTSSDSTNTDDSTHTILDAEEELQIPSAVSCSPTKIYVNGNLKITTDRRDEVEVVQQTSVIADVDINYNSNNLTSSNNTNSNSINTQLSVTNTNTSGDHDHINNNNNQTSTNPINVEDNVTCEDIVDSDLNKSSDSLSEIIDLDTLTNTNTTPMLKNTKNSEAFCKPLDISDDEESNSKLIPGSIAEREHKKWYNAVEMPNNPYAPEALLQRLDNGPQKPIDILERHVASPTITTPEEEIIPEDNLIAKKVDLSIYSRDYYVPGPKPSARNRFTKTPSIDMDKDTVHSSPSDVNDTKKSETGATEVETPVKPISELSLATQATHFEHKNTYLPDNQICLDKSDVNDTDTSTHNDNHIFSARLIQINSLTDDETYKSINELASDKCKTDNSSTSSDISLQNSLTLSENSDTLRIYNLNKQEATFILSENRTEIKQKTPAQSDDVAITGKENFMSTPPNTPATPPTPISATALQKVIPKAPRVRPNELKLTPQSSQSPKQSGKTAMVLTPQSFKFLHPKRKIIEPSQIMTQEQYATPPETPDKVVIEEDVVHSLPSVKALAKAFLLTSGKCSTSHEKVRPKSMIIQTNTTVMKESIKKSSSEEKLSSTTENISEQIKKPTESQNNPPTPPEKPSSPVLFPRKLKDNIAFFENLKKN